MSYIKKPNIFRSNAPKNELGMTYTDYEGAMSTLCAGCGHDSITGAIIQSVFDHEHDLVSTKMNKSIIEITKE